MFQVDTIIGALKAFAHDTSGATAIEYGFIALLVSISIVAGATTIGSSDIVTLKTVTDVWPK